MKGATKVGGWERLENSAFREFPIAPYVDAGKSMSRNFSR